jgi:hypothetical protein
MAYDKKISSYKGCKPKQIQRRRLKPILVRLTPSEHARLFELAEHNDTSCSSMMRDLLLRELGSKGISVEKHFYAQ